jgi:dTDP-4-dehydrorhamnose reductase
MKKKLLLLGATGKMGTAISKVFADKYILEKRNSKDFDALDFNQVKDLVESIKPDIIINAVAFLAIDPSEESPETSFQSNTLYPRLLAQLSKKHGFFLIHFSTDAVFNDKKQDFHVESDIPCPLNMYGMTKYAGDCMIQSIAENYYIIRIPVLFGETPKKDQFVEKMLQRIEDGHKELCIANDIISSPSYSYDISTKIKEIIESNLESGVYHVSNQGKASLYELMCEIVKELGLDVEIKKASFKDFPHIGRKNSFTPIKSEKIESLRSWQEAVADYCSKIKE